MGGASSNLTIDNIKAFSSHEWSDGIDTMSCRHIRIRNCFLRTSDDCITVYGSRRDFQGGASDWEVSDCVLWADKAHAIFIGMHGAYWAEGDVLEDLRFRNIDILETCEDSPKYFGAMAITCGDKNTVRQVLFQDIRVEHIPEGRGNLIHLNFDFYEPSTTPGRRIENITFRNVSYNGNEGSAIEGARGGTISGVTFDNLLINGRRINSAKDGKFTVTGNVTGVIFGPN
jgi:polygalacturonase